jgi:predicted enzyme related to lactoylglutathione lyase
MDRIDYIEFPTSDGGASGKFFTDAFGWKLDASINPFRSA